MILTDQYRKRNYHGFARSDRESAKHFSELALQACRNTDTLKSEVRECCCEMKNQFAQNALNQSKHFSDLSYQVARGDDSIKCELKECCCHLEKDIHKVGDRTEDLVRENELRKVRDDALFYRLKAERDCNRDRYYGGRGDDGNSGNGGGNGH